MAETPRAMITKLNNDNYQSWKFKVELLLTKEGLWDTVRNDKPNPETAEWKTKDGQARATIGLLVEDDQLTHVREAATAKIAWEALKNYHQKASLSSKVFLFKNLCSMKLSESGNMEEHILKMSSVKDKLNAAGEEIKENLFIAMLLCSLPESYNSLINGLESRPDADLTISLVKGKLIDEFRRRIGNSNIDQEDNRALKTQDGQKFKKQFNKNTKECYFCKRTGHLKKDCWKYKAWKEKTEKVNQVTENNNNICFHTDSGTCIKESWYIDSGATSHMTNNKEFFNIEYTDIKDKVTVADGKEVTVSGIGSGTIECNGNSKIITLKNVLYVPKLYGNLLSVKKITENGFKVEFQEKGCNILRNKEIIATANSVKNLYELRNGDKVLSTISKHNNNCIHAWHRRLGHRNPDAIKRLKNEEMGHGIIMQDCGIKEVCETCVRGKLSQKSYPKQSKRKTESILEIVHTDVCGPMQTATPGGKRYTLTMIDDYSGYTEVKLMTHKSEVCQHIKAYVELVKNKFNKKPKILRSDRGKEYVNHELMKYFKDQGIKSELTAPYSPQQNGKAERKNRYLMEMTRCMLIDSGLDKKYWGEAITTANYIQNRLPYKMNKATPYEQWNSSKPELKDIHIFGCEAYAQIPNEQRRKLDDKARKLHFVGYSEESKAFRLLNKETNKITISRNVIFLDKVSKQEEQITEESKDCEVEVDISQKKKEKKEPVTEKAEELKNNSPRKSMRINKGKPPDRLGVREYAGAIISSDEEPKTIEEALGGKDKKKWRKALDEEYSSLIENNTWELVELPRNSKVIGSKWVFKAKRNAEGHIVRHKARLVALGYNQEYGIDYDKTFAPVVRQVTLRILLTIAGRDKMQVHHYDIKNAFLNGELKETLYMQQPKGYEVNGKEHQVLKLNKTLYGLKQSANIWNECITKEFEKLKYKQSKTDPCLYVKNNAKGRSYIIIHVDDILLATNNQEETANLEKALSNSFEITKLGKITNYSGIQVETDKNGIYYIHQQKHISEVIETYGLKDAKGSNIPISVGYEKVEDNSQLPSNKQFQSIIGSLMYIATSTRPDIMASVVILSRKMNKPNNTDWTEAKRIVRYLKNTFGYKLKLGDHKQKKNELITYTDANWAESRVDRKSNSGYNIKYWDSTISWACKKQACVSLSSTEAEYISLSEGCQEMLWITKLLEDFGEKLEYPITFYQDNQSCIKLAENRKFNRRTKHIDTKVHFIRDLVEGNKINLIYCPSEIMIADLLTKPLQRIRLKRLSEECGLVHDVNKHDDVIEEEC